MDLVPLSRLTSAQISELVHIVSDPSVMETIRDGKPWTENYVRQLVEQTIGDDASKDQYNRTYFNWGVTVQGTLVGYAGIRPIQYTGISSGEGLQIRRIIAKEQQRHGYGTQLLHLIVDNSPLKQTKRGCKNLWSLVKTYNAACRRTLEKAGWIQYFPDTTSLLFKALTRDGEVAYVWWRSV